MTIIGIQEIARLCQEPSPLIGNADQDQLCSKDWKYHPASYDLRLGDKVYVAGEWIRVSQLLEETLTIPAFGLCYVVMYETVNLPADLAAEYDIRQEYLNQGLTVQTGLQIDPGYEGKIWMLLFNFTDNPVPIPHKNRIATIEFHKVAGDIRYTPRKRLTSLEDVVPSGRKMVSAWFGIKEIVREAVTQELGERMEVHERRIDSAVTRVDRLSVVFFTFLIISVAVIGLIVAPQMIGAAAGATLSVWGILAIATPVTIVALSMIRLAYRMAPQGGSTWDKRMRKNTGSGDKADT